MRVLCLLLLIKLISRKIDFSSFGRRPSVRRTRGICLKNNSLYRLRCRRNPQTLSLATHDGWRSVNATPRMAHRVTGAILRIYLFCCGNYSVENKRFCVFCAVCVRYNYQRIQQIALATEGSTNLNETVFICTNLNFIGKKRPISLCLYYIFL